MFRAVVGGGTFQTYEIHFMCKIPLYDDTLLTVVYFLAINSAQIHTCSQ